MISNLPVKFGDYTLHKLIARGGMAEVYRGTKAGIGGFEKPVAIKMILPHLASNQEFIAMLTDEARIIVSANHANIAQVYDFCFHEGRYFIAMEYVHGIDVADLGKRMKRLGERVAIEHSVYIALCMCAGLHFAHTKTDKNGKIQNIVHRDISPQNILLSYAGEVKIIDFGIAKAKNRDATTQAGMIKGKLHYMAPEQASGKEIDGRADIFSTGVVLYELLTGQLPFDGETEFEIYNNIMNAVVMPPSKLNPQIPEALDKIVLKMLDRDLSTRYQNGYFARQDLERVLQQIAPGYTNTRLSRYIEQMMEREKSRTPALSEAHLDYLNIDLLDESSDVTDTRENSSFLIEDKESTAIDVPNLEELEGEAVTEAEYDDSDDQEETQHPPVRKTSSPTSPLFKAGADPFESPDGDPFNFAPLPPQEPTSNGLTSLTLFVTLCILGFIVVAAASIAIFYVLSPSHNTLPVATATKTSVIPIEENTENEVSNNLVNVIRTKIHEPHTPIVLTFNTTPPGAQVSMNGTLLGTTPFVFYTDKSEKTQTFLFSLPNYNDSTLNIVPNREITESIQLESSASTKSKDDDSDKSKKRHKRVVKPKRDSGTGLIDPFAN